MKDWFRIKQIKDFSVLFLVLGITLVITSLLRSSYALSSKIYTREEMQDMVVSTALSYFYNNSYSDYAQKPMDQLSDTTNYYYMGTNYWRNLNMTPDMVSRGNYYHVDCSAYTFLTYMNTFGYDASKYSDIARYMLFYGQNDYKMQRVNSFDNRLYYYRDAYKKFGQGWNNSQLTRMANKISNTCSSSTCSYSNKNGVVYNNLDNSKNNELAYYYYADKYQNPETLKNEWSKVKNKLLPGDIILISKSSTSDATSGTLSGHVMLYVGGDDKLNYTNNLLHAIGDDVNFDSTSGTNKLFKKYSIVNSDGDKYIEGLIDGANGVNSNGEGTKYLCLFAIIRPINTMCTNDDSCKISNNENNVSLNETSLANSEARVKLSNYRFEQFMTSHVGQFEKSYDDNNNVINIVNQNNSVNVGDMLRYNLQITNKSKTLQSVFSISDKVPDNTDFVGCTKNCTYDDNTRVVTWNNISIYPGALNTYRYVVIPNKDGVIENDGVSISTPSNTLKLASMKVTAKATFNQSNNDLLKSEINKFKSAINDNKIAYDNNNGDYQFDLDNLTNNVTVSHTGFLKTIYYNAYGIDLGYINGANVKNAVFNKLLYPSLNNNKDKVDDVYPSYTGDTSTNIFSRKTTNEVNNLTNEEYKNINKMLVPGMYGGRNLKGNDGNDRIRFMRSFTNYSLGLSSDLQVGDIIMSFYSNSKYIYVYLVTDFDEFGPVLSMFKSGPKLVEYTDRYLSGDDAYYLNADTYTEDKKPSNQILNELFSKDLFVVLRPSRVYGTTVVKDYNGDSKEDETYVAYDTYKNLDNPVRDGGYEVNYVCGDAICPEKDVSRYVFEGWYSDNKYNEKIENTSKLKSTEAHKIYAKWGNEKIVLPEIEKEGYKFIGWYSDSSYEYKVGVGREEYEVKKNETLYAKFEKVKIDVTSEAMEIENGKIYLSENESEVNRYKELLNIENKERYRIEIYSPEGGKEEGRVYTGSKTRIYLDGEMIEEYENIVRGDVNRTGTVSMADVMKMVNYLLDENTMKEEYNKIAGDIDKNGNIGMNDVMRIVNYLVNGGSL